MMMTSRLLYGLAAVFRLPYQRDLIFHIEDGAQVLPQGGVVVDAEYADPSHLCILVLGVSLV